MEHNNTMIPKIDYVQQGSENSVVQGHKIENGDHDECPHGWGVSE